MRINGTYRFARYKSRYCAVFTPEGHLLCVTLYKKGAEEVVKLLGSLADSSPVPASRSFAAHFGPWEPAFPKAIENENLKGE